MNLAIFSSSKPVVQILRALSVLLVGLFAFDAVFARDFCDEQVQNISLRPETVPPAFAGYEREPDIYGGWLLRVPIRQVREPRLFRYLKALWLQRPGLCSKLGISFQHSSQGTVVVLPTPIALKKRVEHLRRTDDPDAPALGIWTYLGDGEADIISVTSQLARGRFVLSSGDYFEHDLLIHAYGYLLLTADIVAPALDALSVAFKVWRFAKARSLPVMQAIALAELRSVESSLDMLSYDVMEAVGEKSLPGNKSPAKSPITYAGKNGDLFRDQMRQFIQKNNTTRKVFAANPQWQNDLLGILDAPANAQTISIQEFRDRIEKISKPRRLPLFQQ